MLLYSQLVDLSIVYRKKVFAVGTFFIDVAREMLYNIVESEVMELSIGERIREARKAKGYTQQKLADIVGVGKTTINNYESDTREPDALKIIALAKALGVTGDWIIESPWADEAERQRKANGLNDEALAVARDYDALDRRGKTVVRGVLDLETLYLQRASAGTQMYLGANESPKEKPG